MNKSDLISAMASDAGITKAQAQSTLNSLCDSVAGALKSGDKVTLIGFGTFSVSKRAARTRGARIGAESNCNLASCLRLKLKRKKPRGRHVPASAEPVRGMATCGLELTLLLEWSAIEHAENAAAPEQRRTRRQHDTRSNYRSAARRQGWS